jgi:hypothetical protein
VLHVLANLVWIRGDLEEADPLYREGLATRLRLGMNDYRTQVMARQLARVVLQLTGADAVSAEFLRHTQASGQSHIDFALAQDWAQAAEALTERSSNPDEEPELILDYFQGRAVLMLRSAATSDNALDLETLISHPAFAGLQGRGDFQELSR